MKRWILPAAAAAMLVALPACTRTVVREVPVASPVSVGSTSTPGDQIVSLVERVRPAVVNVDDGHVSLGLGRRGGRGPASSCDPTASW